MPERSFPAVAKLIEEAERTAAAGGPNCISTLAAAVRAVIETDADAYLIAGALAEGIVVTITTRIPKEKQPEVAGAMLRLLYKRLQGSGAF